VEYEPKLETAVDGNAVTRLLDLATLAAEFEIEHIAAEAEDLAERVAEGRFFVACVGQFKRGKSTLIGALLGESILPTGFIPITTVPTVVRYGISRKARIRAVDGAWQDITLAELEQYVSEEHNPENMKQIAGAEVFVPSLMLASGMCLVDTPGLGSVHSGNTETTKAFIPHIDAVLVVTGSDPPLAGEELALVEQVAQHGEHLIVVLNKADKATLPEMAAAVAFTQKLLATRLNRPSALVFEISAKERLENRGPERDWRKLVDSLQSLVKDSARELVQSAGVRAIQRLSEKLLAIVREERDALIRPQEESEKRVTMMKQTIADAEQSMQDLAYLLTGEQQRLSDFFLERRNAWLAVTMPKASEQLEEALQSAPQSPGPSYRRHVMGQAQDIARNLITPWLGPEQEEGEKQFRRVVRRFAEMGNDFLAKLAQEEIPELGPLLHALDAEKGFRIASEFSFQEFNELADPASPLRWQADLRRGIFGVRRKIDQDAREFLNMLLEVNSSGVQTDILNRVQESRSRLETDISKLLHEVSRIAELALARARKTHEEGDAWVEAVLLRLNSLEKEIKAIRNLQPPQEMPPTYKEEELADYFDRVAFVADKQNGTERAANFASSFEWEKASTLDS
jgi:GTPase Era involved in 16S rRNA processing